MDYDRVDSPSHGCDLSKTLVVPMVTWWWFYQSFSWRLHARPSSIWGMVDGYGLFYRKKHGDGIRFLIRSDISEIRWKNLFESGENWFWRSFSWLLGMVGVTALFHWGAYSDDLWFLIRSTILETESKFLFENGKRLISVKLLRVIAFEVRLDLTASFRREEQGGDSEFWYNQLAKRSIERDEFEKVNMRERIWLLLFVYLTISK